MDRMLVRLSRLARLLFAFIFIINGLNWWWKILPYPSVTDQPLPQTPPFVQAMIDTGFMFAGTKVIEVVTGLSLLLNRWVPLALVVAFPVTVGIWAVDFLLIATSPRAQILGWSVLILNIFLLFSYLRYFRSMLISRAVPWTADVDRPGSLSDLGRNWSRPLLTALGVLSVVLGLAATVWLIVMLVQQFPR